MKYAVALCVTLLLLVGCSDKNSTSPLQGNLVLTGQVRNQSGNPANGLRVSVSGSGSLHLSTVTGPDGRYSISGIPDGAMTVTLDSSGIVVHDLPRFLAKDTLISMDSSMALNMSVREFTTLLYDSGNRPELWEFTGGVSHDSSRYIFRYMNQYVNMMRSRVPFEIPPDARDIGFILSGEAGPNDSSHISIWAIVNGIYADSNWAAFFQEAPSYFHQPLAGLAGLPGSGLQLEMRYNPVIAEYVYVREIWAYCY